MKTPSIEKIKHKFLFVSSKAGVGQTTVTTNLAVGLSQQGAKVGLLDFDTDGPDIHRLLNIEGRLKTDLEKRIIPWDYSDNLKVATIKHGLLNIDPFGGWHKSVAATEIQRFLHNLNWGSLDYLLVDTPPGPGLELRSMIQTIPDANTVIVSAPNKISGEHAKNMIDFFRKEKIQIFGWIENMRGFWCQDCGRREELFSTGSGNRAIFLTDIPFLGRIPIDPHIVKCADLGESFLEKYPASEAATAYQLIAEKIKGICAG